MKVRKTINYCLHLQPPASPQACSSFMKKEKRQKYRRKESRQEKGREKIGGRVTSPAPSPLHPTTLLPHIAAISSECENCIDMLQMKLPFVFFFFVMWNCVRLQLRAHAARLSYCCTDTELSFIYGKRTQTMVLIQISLFSVFVVCRLNWEWQDGEKVWCFPCYRCQTLPLA